MANDMKGHAAKSRPDDGRSREREGQQQAIERSTARRPAPQQLRDAARASKAKPAKQRRTRVP
jgi:hypothetical protein